MKSTTNLEYYRERVKLYVADIDRKDAEIAVLKKEIEILKKKVGIGIKRYDELRRVSASYLRENEALNSSFNDFMSEA